MRAWISNWSRIAGKRNAAETMVLVAFRCSPSLPRRWRMSSKNLLLVFPLAVSCAKVSKAENFRFRASKHSRTRSTIDFDRLGRPLSKPLRAFSSFGDGLASGLVSYHNVTLGESLPVEPSRSASRFIHAGR
jgi:hypothetical protein